MDFNAIKKFIDSMCGNCNPSHRTVWTRSFVRKIIQRFITSENRTELSIKNYRFRCWFTLSKSIVILYGSNACLVIALRLDKGPEFLRI